MIGNRHGAGEPPARFGYEPSGPKVDVARIGAARFGQVRGRPRGRSNLNVGNVTFGGALPSPAALDYAHKLTSTTILLVGAIAFLVLGPRTWRGKLHSLARKHVGGS